MMTFNHHRRPAVGRPAFDDIGIKGTLCKEFGVIDIPRFRLEYLDERFPDYFSFFLRIDNTLQRLEKFLFRIDNTNIQRVIFFKNSSYFINFISSQQAVINKDRFHLLTDCPINKGRNNGGINTARQGTDDAGTADLRSNPFHRFLNIHTHIPATVTSGNAVEKVAEDVGALRRMNNLGMKLDSVDLSFIISHGGYGTGRCPCHNLKSTRNVRHVITMTHPDIECIIQTV